MNISKHFICIAVFLLTLLFSSCNLGNKNVDHGYYVQDFDNLYYWYHPAQVTKERAHSGSYSTYVDETHPFSQTFEMNLGEAKYKGYKKIRIKAWCFKETVDTQAGLSASVTSGSTQLAYNSSDLAVNLLRPQSWGLCTFSLDLPEENPADGLIRVYLWTVAGHKAYVDDVEIIFKK